MAHAVRRWVILGLTVAVAATVIGPVKSSLSPFWKGAPGLDDQALILGDKASTSLNTRWAALPGAVSCVPRGGAVASTEIGYLGYERLDLRLIDLQGLTDRTIAKDSPRSHKSATGVDVNDWSDARSVVGKRILATRPEAILVDKKVPSRSACCSAGTTSVAWQGVGSFKSISTAEVTCPTCVPPTGGRLQRTPSGASTRRKAFSCPSVLPSQHVFG